MPNEQNLIPQAHVLTVEEQSKGGVESGKSKRRRRTLKEELLLMLEDPEVQQSVAAALIREATEGNNAGSVRGAFETIRDTIGEKPTDKIEMKTDVDVAAASERLKKLFDRMKNDG